jgi:hypothetical protein
MEVRKVDSKLHLTPRKTMANHSIPSVNPNQYYDEQENTCLTEKILKHTRKLSQYSQSGLG